MILPTSREELERQAQAGAQSHYLGDRTVLCRALGRFPLFVDSSDVAVSPWLIMTGYWESWVTLVVDELVKPGMRVVDAGANMGYYSVLMAACAGPTGRLLAVEANPRLAELVRRSLALNGSRSWSSVESCALSDGPGVATLAVSPGDLGGASVRRAPGENDAAITVLSHSIDNLTESWDRVDFIRMDIEGSEHAAWRGMQTTIRRNPNLVVATEFNPSRFDDAAGFLMEIQESGFNVYSCEPDGLERVSADRVLTDTNKDWMLVLVR